MHLLDDLDGLSSRAQTLLRRTGWRVPPEPDLQTQIEHVRLIGDEFVTAPPMLIIRREGFALRYGGLRYTVRRFLVLDGQRHEMAREWNYDLGGYAWADKPGDWYFDWFGERVSSPIRHLVHTDGRVGAEDGSSDFLEIAPSLPTLIESHALMDELAQWDLCLWNVDIDQLGDVGAELVDVPEASGPTVRWRISPTLAVQEFQSWTHQQPRPWRAVAWTRGGRANRLLEAQASASGRR
ncbi:hypothetical protein ABH920_008946 [Catenulispora sp. EB89]|uniref:hypothetical protein n=1 Tax=Catenulispora sp. EB89 TaxID=3156257 RepID=UPI003511901B